MAKAGWEKQGWKILTQYPDGRFAWEPQVDLATMRKLDLKVAQGLYKHGNSPGLVQATLNGRLYQTSILYKRDSAGRFVIDGDLPDKKGKIERVKVLREVTVQQGSVTFWDEGESPDVLHYHRDPDVRDALDKGGKGWCMTQEEAKAQGNSWVESVEKI